MTEINNNLVLFSGTSNISLSERVAKKLGKKLGSAFVGRFSDDELNVRIDENVRGMDVFIVCLLYTSPSPRDLTTSRMPSSA